MEKLKKMVNAFTAKTFGEEIPEGLSFSTCYPISILLDRHQIHNTISLGSAFKNGVIVSHCWLTLDNEGTILDPTIRQFNPNMASTYIGKLNENEITRNYISISPTTQNRFEDVYELWAEPLIDKQPRTLKREPIFEAQMNTKNVITASVLYACILQFTSHQNILNSDKCVRYFSPIKRCIQEKYKSDKTSFEVLKAKMPQEFDLFLPYVLQGSV